MKKKISAIICMVLAFTMLWAMPVSAAGLGDGVWNVGRTVSYIDPVTKKNPTGSGDSSFGQNIANNVLEKTMLIENAGGKTYYTIGMGFMSYAGNGQRVKVEVQQKSSDAYASYKTVSTTWVNKDHDLCDGGECHHLKFEVPFEGARVCVSYFVQQMNREVFFFIDPKLDTAVSGKGAFGTRTDGDVMRQQFEVKIGEKQTAPRASDNDSKEELTSKKKSGVSKMASASNNGQKVDPNELTTVAETTTAVLENAETTIAASAEANAQAEQKQSSNNWLWIVVAIAAAAIIAVVVIAIVKKKKAN